MKKEAITAEFNEWFDKQKDSMVEAVPNPQMQKAMEVFAMNAFYQGYFCAMRRSLINKL